MPKEVASAVAKNKLALEASKEPAGDLGEDLPQMLKASVQKTSGKRPSKFSKVGQAPTDSRQFEISE